MKDYNELLNAAVIGSEEWLEQAQEYAEIKLTDEVTKSLIRLSSYEALCLLAAGKAHDFRNMLTIVNGDIALCKIKCSEDPQLLKWLTDAEAALEQAHHLASELLNLARGSCNGKKIISTRDFLLEVTQITLGAYDVIPTYEISKDLWDIFIDERQISQVLVNLLMNAVQAMNNRGQIWITAVNKRLNEEQSLLTPGGYVKISIRDQGVGIPEEYRENIFQPFFTTKAEGSGLGLSTSSLIIRENQGYMNFISDPGGTTFFILLPAVIRQAAASLLPE